MSSHPCETGTIARLAGELRQSPGLRVRSLHCPIESAVHPEVDLIHARSVVWARDLGLAQAGTAEARLHAARIGWLVARAHPRGDTAIVQLAADWTTVFCLLDDRLERLESPAAVAGYLSALSGILRHGGDPGLDPVKRACADLRSRLLGAAPASFHARWNERIDQLFAAFGREAAVRAARVVPELGDYLPMREVTVGIHVELEIGELASGIELSEAARNHPVRVALARMASNLIGWANDVFTFEKELRQGETTNLVAVLAQSHGLGLADALAAASARHDEEMQAFLALAAEVPKVAGGAELQGHVALLRAWVRGHLDWAHETGRYDPGLSPPRSRVRRRGAQQPAFELAEEGHRPARADRAQLVVSPSSRARRRRARSETSSLSAIAATSPAHAR